MIDFSIKNEADKGKFRSIFNRDRDRIIYSRDFLRLGGKTQVFVDGFDDHMRNRLSHTMEVVQLSRKISKSLKLNLDLTEAIAFGHDIGHTPFGHAGERVLNKIMNGCYKINGISLNPIKNNSGFKHNWQGIRVARDLNVKYDGTRGLDLSKYTEWGILNHTNLKYKLCDRLIEGKNCGNNYDHEDECKCPLGFNLDFYNRIYPDINKIENLSFEAIVVSRADEIAQRHHDIEDGLVAGLITIEEIIKRLPLKTDPIYQKLFKEEKELIKSLSSKSIEKGRKIKILSHLMHGIYSRDIIAFSHKNLFNFAAKNKIHQNFNFQKFKLSSPSSEEEYVNMIDFSDELKIIDNELKKYLKSAILNSMMAQSMDSKAEYIIIMLISAYIRYPQYLPQKTIIDILNRINQRHSNILIKKEYEDVREFVADKHFTKIHRPEYMNYFIRGICDFIAGMTDDYAYKQFDLIYGTKKTFSKPN